MKKSSKQQKDVIRRYHVTIYDEKEMPICMAMVRADDVHDARSQGRRLCEVVAGVRGKILDGGTLVCNFEAGVADAGGYAV